MILKVEVLENPFIILAMIGTAGAVSCAVSAVYTVHKENRMKNSADQDDAFPPDLEFSKAIRAAGSSVDKLEF